MSPYETTDSIIADFEAYRRRGVASKDGGGGTIGGNMNDRIGKVETDVASIKGSLDWAKIAFATLTTVTIGCFAIIITLLVFTLNQIRGISTRIADEFKSQRSEQSAQISTLANVITATKQQAPQVLLVPTPLPDEPSLKLPPLQRQRFKPRGAEAYEKPPFWVPLPPSRQDNL